MKVKIEYEFDSIQDEFEMKAIQTAIDFKFAIMDFDNILRDIIKHNSDSISEKEIKGYRDARDLLYRCLDDRGVMIYD